MTEIEKCMTGEYYNCHDKIFLDIKSHARILLQKYNALAYEQKAEKINILKQLLEVLLVKIGNRRLGIFTFNMNCCTMRLQVYFPEY